MKTMALDVGTKRIGVAVSDGLGLTAQGRQTIERRSDAEVMAAIAALVAEEGVGTIVIGMPLNMNGSEGPKAKEVGVFSEKLKLLVSIPIIFWDERLSTVAAERFMISADTSRGKRKTKIDRLAAQLILQAYLDSIYRREDE